MLLSVVLGSFWYNFWSYYVKYRIYVYAFTEFYLFLVSNYKFFYKHLNISSYCLINYAFLCWFWTFVLCINAFFEAIYYYSVLESSEYTKNYWFVFCRDVYKFLFKFLSVLIYFLTASTYFLIFVFFYVC